MANIQPFNYQETTNIEEHNQIVNKVNEIVEVINNVNLDTINSEIANLKANATATDTEIANIKNKDSTQDTEIDGITKSLVSNVTATFDNPSRELKISLGREASPSIDATVVIPASSETGQYSAGNGITIENYQIAVDTGVVALKTDIPIVPDVTDINNRLDTIDGEITGINADITNLTNKNTEQDTAIAGKVAISQGIENAGKVLGIGPDGNVTPVTAGGSSGGGEVWEEVDLSNFPTDWVAGDRVKISAKYLNPTASSTNWNGSIDNGSPGFSNAGTPIVEFIIDNSGFYTWAPVYFFYDGTNAVVSVYTVKLNTNISAWNGSNPIMYLELTTFNGNTISRPTSIQITGSASKLYIYKMWRCRASQ